MVQGTSVRGDEAEDKEANYLNEQVKMSMMAAEETEDDTAEPINSIFS